MWSLLKKEMLEFLRDKRAIVAAFSMGIFGPCVMLVMLESAIEQELEEFTPTLILTDIKEGSYLTQYLTEQGIEFSHQEIGLEEFKRRDENGWLVESEGNLTLYTRLADKESQKAQYRLEAIMGQFVKKVTSEHMMAKGIDVRTTPFEIYFHEVKEKDVNAGRILGSLLIFILTAPFFAAIAVANDTTAGERERGTLMSLMSQPISPWSVAFSKWLIVTLVGMIGVAITLSSSALAFEYIPLYKVGITVAIDFSTWLTLFFAMIPIAMMGAALQIAVAITAKSFKEGTSLLSMVSVAPMAIAFIPITVEHLGMMEYFPILAQQVMFENLFLNLAIDWKPVLSSFVISMLMVVICLKIFREKITQPHIVQGY